MASLPQLPYDAAPPPGLAGRVGITVEGLFLPPGQDNWALAQRQPGFLYQDYEREQVDGREWLYPRGEPVWTVRFAPTESGEWRYRVRAQDAGLCPAGPIRAWSGPNRPWEASRSGRRPLGCTGSLG